MKRVKVLLDFLKYSVVRKIEFGRNVITKMTGNASFTNPDLTLAQATTLTNNIEAALIAADGGSKAAKASLLQAEKLWDEGFRKMVLYVERIALGNEALILSAGFECTHQPAPALHPEFVVKHGKMEGEVLLSHKAVQVRAAWVWQCVPDPIPANEKEWIQAGITLSAKFKINGLESGKKYWFRVAVVTTKGQGPWCDPFGLRIL
ncbi:MAG: fibronectin type III domain-containing protein [Bacteroidota bacterium]